jgi:hypothetical protein
VSTNPLRKKVDNGAPHPERNNCATINLLRQTNQTDLFSRHISSSDMNGKAWVPLLGVAYPTFILMIFMKNRIFLGITGTPVCTSFYVAAMQKTSTMVLFNRNAITTEL